jgi:hypothetical protein
VLKALMKLRIAIEGRRRIDKGPKVDVRRDAARPNHRGALLEHRGLAEVSPNHREQRQLVERLMKGGV